MRDMIDVIDFEITKIARRQILVVECESPLTAEQQKNLRNEIRKQMQSGLVLLPDKCKAITCDEDAIIVLPSACGK